MPLISTTPYNVTPFLGFLVSQGTPFPVYIRPDGLKFYLGFPNDGNEVHQYSMSSAFDLTTASYDSLSAAVTEAGVINSNPFVLYFSSDGTTMYIGGNTTTDDYYSYTLSSAWDVSTATYDSVTLSAAGSNPRAVFFKSDGTRLFSVESGFVRSYTLSSGWDLSTATYDSKFFDARPQDNDASGIALNADGLTMFTSGLDGDAVNEYSLSVAHDITTASFVQSYSINTTDFPSIWGMSYRESTFTFYICNASVGGIGESVFEFSI